MSKKRILLQEFIEVKDASIELYEEDKAKASGFLGSFSGIAHNVGKLTLNKTLYRRSIMHREVERIQPLMGEGKIVALADHPGWDTNQVLTLAVRWTKAWIDDKNDLQVEGGILKTNAGTEVKAAREGGVLFGLSLRGYGSILVKTMDETSPEWEANREHEGVEYYEIQDDYEMETPADIVLSPSSAGSWSAESRKEALQRLEAASKTEPEESVMEKIKNLKTLRENVSAEVVDAIVAEMTEGLIKSEDADAAQTAAVETAKTEAATATLADETKVAEAVGMTPALIGYVKANAEKLEACAVAEFPLDALDPAKTEAAKTETEKQIKTLENANKAMTEKVEKLTAKADASEKALSEQKLAGALRKMVEAATVGGKWADTLTEKALADLTLAEDFDADDADKVKIADKMIENYLSAKRAEFEGIAKDAGVPKAKGKGANEGGGDADTDEIVEARKAFAEDYPSFVPNVHNFENAQASARSNGLGDVFEALYGKAAIEAVPLD